MNRKFHISQISHSEKLVPILTAREELVPIRHIFHTNISHFVKCAHEVKSYVAYMRNLHIDKIPPKSVAFCMQFQFFTFLSGFYNVVQTGYRQISYVLQLKKSWTGVRLQIILYYMSRVARTRFFGVHAPDSPACVHVDTETKASLLILD